jgi:hypothetical protein
MRAAARFERVEEGAGPPSRLFHLHAGWRGRCGDVFLREDELEPSEG